MVETISGNPYTDDGKIRTILRESEELVWHRDGKNRIITVLEGAGWQLQYNGELPVELKIGEKYFIPEMMYHRVIRGVNDLVVEISECQ